MSEIDQREQKNAALFSGATPNQKGVSMIEAAREKLDLEIPFATVPLPSGGLVYPPSSPYHGKTEVEIKAMTTKEEDILMSRALIKKGTVLTELIRSCIMNPGVDVNELLSGDRMALMVAIRMTGYGNEYTPEIKCPSCEKLQKTSVDLSQLDIKNLTLEPDAKGENRFSFTLPVCKKTVQFRFLTGKEEEEITTVMESRKNRGIQIDNAISTRLIYSIISVDGRTEKGFISDFANNMPARDSLSLRKYIEANEPGVEMKFQFTCVECSHTGEVAVPIGAAFFWPQS